MTKRIYWISGAVALVAVAAIPLIASRFASDDECGSRKLIQENMKLAAENRPVAEWVTYTDRDNPWNDEMTASEGTVNSLLDLTRKTPEELHQLLAENRLNYALESGYVTLTRTSGPGSKEPLIIHTLYRFPNASVGVGDDISDVVNKLRAAHENKQVRYFSALTVRSSLDEWENQDYYWGTLRNAIRAFGDGKEAFPCVRKTIAVSDSDSARPLSIPMLEVGRGRYVGFFEMKVITHNTLEGWSAAHVTTRSYPLPTRK